MVLSDEEVNGVIQSVREGILDLVSKNSDRGKQYP